MPLGVRNPFRKQDENTRPALVNGIEKPVSGTRPVDITEKEPTEYKLSEINDSGVYLPPSPPDPRKSFWHTNSSRSTTSSNHRSVINENEQFHISRESFDSYRRSFDISARSPIPGVTSEARSRQSLDSRTFLPPPRMSNSFPRPSPQAVKETREEEFEDVNIDDPKPQPKKRGIFSRLTDSSDQQHVSSADGRPTTSHEKVGSSWHAFGRKRGQSGQGAELGSITKRPETPKPESTLRRVETPKPESNQTPKVESVVKRAETPKPESNQTPKVESVVKRAETPKAAAENTQAPKPESMPKRAETPKPKPENTQAPDIRVDS